MSIIIFISILFFCNTSTEDPTFLYRNFTFGQTSTFQFIRGYKTFILKGSINQQKEISFSIRCKPLIYQIKYLFTNMDYNTEDEMISLNYQFPNLERRQGYYLDEYIFKAKTEGEYQNFYLGISLSEILDYSTDITVNSSFPSSLDTLNKINFAILSLLFIIFCILICVLECRNEREGLGGLLFCLLCCCCLGDFR